MRLVLIASVAVVAASLCSASTAPQASEQPNIEYGKPFPLIGIAEDAPAEVEPLAKEVAQALGISKSGISFRGKKTPVCCIWFEINRFTPNPGRPGYIILNQPGGSLVIASDVEQMKRAVAAFKKSIRRRDGNAEIPYGLMTNYPVIAPPAAN